MMPLLNDRERKIYLAESAQIHGLDEIERERQSERAVMLDRELRTNGFRQQVGGGGPDNRGRRNYKRFGKRPRNGAELRASVLLECKLRFGADLTKWEACPRNDNCTQAKRFAAAGLLSILGRNLAARALEISDCSVDAWTKNVRTFPVEAIEGEKFAATLVVDWEEYAIERKDVKL